MIDHRGEVLFLPADPPRLGSFALWRPPPAGGPPRLIDVVLPDGGEPRSRSVPARLIPVAIALPWLATLPDEAVVRASQRAWATAVRAAVTLVAAGRLRPAVSPRGFGAWWAGPLEPTDEAWLDRLADTFPPLAHALPLAGAGMSAARPLITACWDAVADVLVRTAAAARVCPVPALADSEPIAAGQLRPWLEEPDEAVAPGAIRLGVRVDLPEGPGALPAVVLQLGRAGDEAGMIDAGDRRAVPPPLRRLLSAAALDIELTIHRGARLWPPLAELLPGSGAGGRAVSEEELSSLLDVAEDLARLGVEVLWPASLADRGLSLRAVLGSTEVLEPDRPAPFSLDGLLDFRWEVTLGRTALTREEMETLIEGRRRIVRLRDGWVVAEPQMIETLREGSAERLRAGDALAAALTGTVDVGGAIVAARAEGALARLGDRVARAARPEDAVQPAGLTGRLRDYQRRGLAWLEAMCELGLGGCLADDMGLGKTIQVIALQLSRARGPALVVCPASLLGNWERELGAFAPGLPVRRYHGGGRHLGDVASTEVVLATYGVARQDGARLAEVHWDLVVADEAQHMKNPRSRTARELRGIPATARVALTGTPVENRLIDLWSILDWTTPGLLGPLESFRRRVAGPVEQGNDAAAAARFARLIRPFVLRRTKGDPQIAPELPAKTEHDIVVPLSAEQTSLYEAVVRETMEQIQRTAGIRRRGLVLRLLTSLKQICNHPAHYLRQGAPLRGRSGKLDALDEILDVVISEGESVLLFTQYAAMARLLGAHLGEHGIGSLFLHGGVDVRARETMVARFQDGEAPVFLLSLRAGGVGLNLTRATHVVHYDRWWNPAVENQATDRAHRIGQDRPVQVHRLVAEGTVEDRIAALLRSKRDLADRVVGTGEGWLTELSDTELSELVALRASR